MDFVHIVGWASGFTSYFILKIKFFQNQLNLSERVRQSDFATMSCWYLCHVAKPVMAFGRSWKKFCKFLINVVSLLF